MTIVAMLDIIYKPMKFRNLIIHVIVCLLSSVCLVFLRMPAYEEFFLSRFGTFAYDGPAADFKPFDVASVRADDFRFEMSLDFTFLPANFWQDAFQIGSWIEGFRMETNPTGLSGIYTPSREGGVMVNRIGNFGANQKYDLKISATPDQMIFKKNGVPRTFAISFNRSPPFSKVIFGSGFDMKRPFAGKLGNVRMRLETFEHITPGHSGYYLALAVCAALGLFAGARVVRELAGPA